MNRFFRNIAMPIAIIGGAASVATPAFASSSPTSTVTPAQIAQLQSDINSRITFLETLSTRIQGASALSTSDAATLSQVVGSSNSGDIAAMQSLLASVQSITTTTQLHLTYETMYDNYRIYAVVGPQVDMTIAQSQILSISQSLANLEPTLNSLIQSNGNNPTAVAAYSNLQSEVSQAQSVANGLGTFPISLSPSIYNANPTGTHSTVVSDWQQIKSTWTTLKTARQDVSTIIKNI